MYVVVVVAVVLVVVVFAFCNQCSASMFCQRLRVGWGACLYISWRVIILASIDVTSGNRRMVRLQIVYLERTIDVCFSIVLIVLSIVDIMHSFLD